MKHSSPLDLKGISRGSDSRLFLDGAEVWRGLTFLGIISADWFAAKVQEQLDGIEIAEWLRTELAAPPGRRLGPPVDDTRPMLRKPLAFMPIAPTVKAKRRAARTLNKGRRRKAS